VIFETKRWRRRPREEYCGNCGNCGIWSAADDASAQGSAKSTTLLGSVLIFLSPVRVPVPVNVPEVSHAMARLRGDRPHSGNPRSAAISGTGTLAHHRGLFAAMSWP
jgi:hypothetical protein